MQPVHLLSLILPSCMIVPNIDLRNIQISTSAFLSTLQIDCLPASSAMDINFDNVRGRSQAKNILYV